MIKNIVFDIGNVLAKYIGSGNLVIDFEVAILLAIRVVPRFKTSLFLEMFFYFSLRR